MALTVNGIRKRIGQWMLAVVLFAASGQADYPCLCSYQIEAEILSQPKSTAKVDGYMYEFDCKAYYSIPGLDKAYAAVGNDNKYGYVRITSDTQIQVCQGAIPPVDLVTTTPLPTTELTTTQMTTTPPPTNVPTTTQTTTIKTTRGHSQTSHQTPQATTASPPSTTTQTMPITSATATTSPTTITTVTTRQTTTTQPTTSTTATTRPTTMTTIPSPTTSTTLTTQPTTTTSTTTTTTRTTSTTTTTRSPQTTIMSRQVYCNSLIRASNPLYVTNDGSFCYEFVKMSVPWKVAGNDCSNRSGNLLEIDSEAKNNFTVNFIKHIGQVPPIWIGLHDRSQEETWMWDTGISLNKTQYTNWMLSRFHDTYHLQEDCTILVYNRNGQWDDVDCDGISYGVITSYAYICQFKIPAVP